MSTDVRLQRLFDAAFRSGAARDANQEISKARDAFSELSGIEAHSYEVVVPETRAVETLIDETLPRLIYFLHSRGAGNGAGLFLSLFHGDRLYFVAGPDALALFCEWTGLSLADMKARWADGYSKPTLALPGPSRS